MSKETNLSLAHTTWNCKYYVVFAPKYRKKVFFHQKRLEVGAILRSLCEWKNVIIHEAEVCPDHVHMLISIPPKLSVSGFIVAKKSCRNCFLDGWYRLNSTQILLTL